MSSPSSQPSRKDLIKLLLKGIETGDPSSAAVVNEEKYIQHNPQTKEGGDGLAALFARISKSNPRVKVVRAFEDGDFVFGHTEYDFATRRIGFEIFRFEADKAVEHWDNIQPRMGPNGSGRSMVDGPTESSDFHLTESNRKLVKAFIDDIYVNRRLDKLDKYVVTDGFINHSPNLEDGIDALRKYLGEKYEDESGGKVVYRIRYETNHRILAEGIFALSVNEGFRDGVHTSFFDMFRIADEKIAEHWDTVEAVPPKSEWKNNNGKFSNL